MIPTETYLICVFFTDAKIMTVEAL